MSKALAAIAFLGAITAAVVTGPRDLTAYQAALQDLQAKSTIWETEVGETDTARDAMNQAIAAYNAQVQEELTAQAALEASQQAYTDAYDAVEKETAPSP